MYYYQRSYRPYAAQVQSTEKKPQLAQAYVPDQTFRDLYTAEEALKHGTIFKELTQNYRRTKL